jgi:hypothetical protein
VDLARLAVEVVSVERGEVRERDSLQGLAATLTTEAAGSGWRLRAALGSPAAPLDLDVRREPEGSPARTARARLSLAADADPRAANAALDVGVVEQSFLPQLGSDASLAGQDWLHAEVHARFDPEAGRTEIDLQHATVAGGAATADASVVLPDQGDPTVKHAQGDVDLARLLAWVPPGLAPISVDRAHVRYQVEAFVAGPVLRFGDGGAIAVDVDLANVKARLPGGTVGVGAGRLEVHGKPAPGGGIAAQGTLHLDSGGFDAHDTKVAWQDLGADFDGQQATDGALTGHLGLRFAHLTEGGKTAVEVRDGQCDLRAEALHPGADPLASRGDATLAATFGALDVQAGATRVLADRLEVRAHTKLDGGPPYAAEIEAPAARLRVLGAGGRTLADGPVRVEAKVHDAFPDADRPLASRGVLAAAVAEGEARASLDVTKQADAADYSLDARVPSLALVRPLLSAELARAVSWDGMGLTVRSRGHAGGLGGRDPDLREDTELTLEHPALEGARAESLSLVLHSTGTAAHPRADAHLQAHALAVDGFAGGAAADDGATVSVDLDRPRAALRLDLRTEGRLRTRVAATASFDRSRRALEYDLDADLAGLGALAPAAARVRGLEGFDLSGLEIAFKSRGAVLGVLAGVGSDGALTFEPRPSRTVGVDGVADLHLAKFRWHGGDAALDAPVVSWHADLHLDGARRTLGSHLDIDGLHLAAGQHQLDLGGIIDDASAVVTGDLANPASELTQRLSVRSVHQDVAPEYPVGDVDLTLTADRDPEGLIHITEMKLANGAGGTTLGVEGGVDLGVNRRRLSITAEATQDLAPLSIDPAGFAGRGTLAVQARVESPDLAEYRTRVDLKAAGVSVRMPRAGLVLDAVDGQIPITAAVEVGPRAGKSGFAIRRDMHLNPYSMLRFADQHPLLSRSGFLSIGRLETPFVSISPLAGNLVVEQNVVSLRQFEMGVRGGRVTGECALDWEGRDSTLELHVRASGVRSSHGEPFDGNIAVAVAAADRAIEGRAEILRIGPRHLLDLIDMEDPMRVDAAMNRVRSALSFGYPDKLRLVFDHGFASAKLELGGLGRFISIDEIHGIPMGGIVDKFLGPMLDANDSKESP